MKDQKRNDHRSAAPAAHRVLGVSASAGAAEIRAAYLRKVREFPPDRAPREFEQVRDAYEELRDPRKQLRQRLFETDPASVKGLLAELEPARRHVGPEPWLAVLRESKR